MTGESAAPEYWTARGVAARVVHRVLEENAFVSDALDGELVRADLAARDRALATELSYGVVRLERSLSLRLEALARRGVAKGDELSRAHLLVAAYQLLVLDRIPAFAAINEAVSALRRLRGQRVAGFANAVLRRLAKEPRLDLAAALEASVAPWLFDELCRSVGRQSALGLLGVPERPLADTDAEAPDKAASSVSAARRGLSVRLTQRADPMPEWAKNAEPGQLLPSALWLPPIGDLRKLPGYDEGAFVVQEEGAQWAALALGARPGERILDACAGHGQKTSLLAERLGKDGTLWVNDIAPAKLDRLRRELERLHLPQPQSRAIDLTQGIGDLPTDMDRVLVDAPCTGTGTLRRRPEILRRLGPDDPRRLADQATQLLRNAARLARPDGRVLFVVCSVLRIECEDVVDSVADILEPLPFDAPEAVRVAGAGAWQYRLLPTVHGTDGYYVASLRRR
jgi:16S rRNA (cytosine967-C5)-methyltransferase